MTARTITKEYSHYLVKWGSQDQTELLVVPRSKILAEGRIKIGDIYNTIWGDSSAEADEAEMIATGERLEMRKQLKLYKDALPTDASPVSSPSSIAKSTDDSSPDVPPPPKRKRSATPLSVLPIELQPPTPPSPTPSTPQSPIAASGDKQLPGNSVLLAISVMKSTKIAARDLVREFNSSSEPGNFAKYLLEFIFPELYTQDCLRRHFSYHGDFKNNKNPLDQVRIQFLMQYVCHFYSEVKQPQAWKLMVVTKVNQAPRRPVKQQIVL
ncbi:Hypothetical predicted protein [Mytilus galloprovincialis]|uniref:BEN domain-containing protein n=1 Tax=Mytilus galloprovincialis TaxID=29158 RepID=A0A8B6H4H2_MYTGA|nr:Hypothetical predicted protein [Mytilus galloprovincialis]